MPVKFRDYYEILGVKRDADAATIKKAYRKLARKTHPDVDKSSGADARFKEISEAYEVLSDPDKRKRYDTLGANWRDGQEFRPPPGWQEARRDSGRRSSRPRNFSSEDFGGGFSEFFESLFGGGGDASFHGNFGRSTRSRPVHGRDIEAEITIGLADAYHGTRRKISMQFQEMGEGGSVVSAVRDVEFNIPPGTTQGARIRLGGKGGAGFSGGRQGDLYLRVHIDPGPGVRLQGHDVEMDLPVAPWTAALGGEVVVEAPGGRSRIRIAPGTSSGKRVRLKGKGLPRPKNAEAGDLYAVVKIVVPASLTAREAELFDELAKISEFKP
jgi:curved DNA-binding protein